MPEANRTLELAKRLRDAASVESAMPHYSQMMLRAAAELEAFACDRSTSQDRLCLPTAA